jgi:hypothetical protein
LIYLARQRRIMLKRVRLARRLKQLSLVSSRGVRSLLLMRQATSNQCACIAEFRQIKQAQRAL